MAAKKKAAKAGAGAYAAGKAVRSNQYVQRLMEDEELRDNLRNAFTSAKNAYGRINGKGPVKAVTENKKVQRDLREAATSLKDAAESLRDGKKKKRGKGRLLLIAIIGGGIALAASEGLRKKVQRELKDAAASLKEAADSLRGQKKRKRKKGRLLFVGLVGAGLALALSEGLRKKVLDGLFGAEEEFEYSASTTPEASSNSTTSESSPVGAN